MKLDAHLPAVLAVLLGVQAVPAAAPDLSHSSATRPVNNSSTPLVRRPVVFEPNVGQFPAGVRYHADVAGRSLSITDAAVELSLGGEPQSVRPVRMMAVGASAHARPVALDRLAGVVNHFEGTSPSAWHAGVPTFGRVRYPAVYPGVDLVYHGSPDQLEYDFVVERA